MTRLSRNVEVKVGQRVGVLWSKMRAPGEVNRWRYGVVVWAFRDSATVRMKFDNDFPDTERNCDWKDVFPEATALEMAEDEKAVAVMAALEKAAK